MTITTDNYEEYFYQYCEGGLTAKERAAVEAFAAQHPELADELSLYDPALKLEESPMSYPDKESLLRHEAKVLLLWRWVAAACVAAVLIGGVWLMRPDGNVPKQAGMVAQMRQPTPAPQPAEPIVEHQDETPATVVEPASSAAPLPETAAPVHNEPPEPLPQYEPPTIEEPALLADAEPMPQQEDTMVIEYIETTLFPTYQSQVEVVAVAYQPTVGDRFRAFRSRVSNTVRDYAYQSYSDTRAELLTRINY